MQRRCRAACEACHALRNGLELGDVPQLLTILNPMEIAIRVSRVETCRRHLFFFVSSESRTRVTPFR